MFENFATEARRVVVLAQEEARDLNHSRIDCEHILLSVLAQESEATTHLGGYTLTYEEVHQQILAAHPKGEVSPQGHIPFTNEARRALIEATNIALEYSPPRVDVEHLALALLDTANPTVVSVLTELEVSKELIREDLTDSARSKANARHATRNAPSSAGNSTESSPHTTLMQLLKDDSIPRRNLVEALTIFTTNVDDEVADELIEILKK